MTASPVRPREEGSGGEPRLSGRWALVTGAGSGLGRSIAHRFTREGAAGVAIVDRVSERVDRVCQEVSALGGRALALTADVGQPAECERIVAETVDAFGGLNLVVSNAAISSSGELTLDMTLDSWNRMLAINLTAGFLIARTAARHMSETGGGAILFTSSVGGTWGQPGGAHYSVTKAGIANLTKTMALEYGRYGIRVNCVSPGGMDTNMIAEYQGEEAAERQRQGSTAAALGRIAAPEEVAAVFAFLASSDASFITGTNVFVDGGVTAGLPTHVVVTPVPR